MKFATAAVITIAIGVVASSPVQNMAVATIPLGADFNKCVNTAAADFMICLTKIRDDVVEDKLEGDLFSCVLQTAVKFVMCLAKGEEAEPALILVGGFREVNFYDIERNEV